MATPEAAPGYTKSPAANGSRLQPQLLRIERCRIEVHNVSVQSSFRKYFSLVHVDDVWPYHAWLRCSTTHHQPSAAFKYCLAQNVHGVIHPQFHAFSTHARIEVCPVTTVCGLRGVVGLRWRADVSLACVCLQRFPALIPACLYLSNYRVSVSHTLSAGCTKLVDQTCAYTACREPPLENLASVSILASLIFAGVRMVLCYKDLVHSDTPHSAT